MGGTRSRMLYERKACSFEKSRRGKPSYSREVHVREQRAAWLVPADSVRMDHAQVAEGASQVRGLLSGLSLTADSLQLILDAGGVQDFAHTLKQGRRGERL